MVELSFSPSSPLVVATTATLDEAREAVVQGAGLVEVRPDLIGQSLEQVMSHFESVKSAVSVPLLGTVRLPADGGKFLYSDEDRYAMFHAIIGYINAVDIEVDSVLRDGVTKLAHDRNVSVVCSYHNMERTLARNELSALIQRMESTGCDAIKIAMMARSRSDFDVMFDATVEHVARLSKPIAMVSMGEEGKIGRKTLPWVGSCMTYGCVYEPRAPGQVKINELKSALDFARERDDLPVGREKYEAILSGFVKL
jgi:3-dehydroquinate dehydratase-1